MSFDLKKIRASFPMVGRDGVVYLDNATTQYKPSLVIDRVVNFYSSGYGSVYRGMAGVTEEYSSVRELVCDFIGAESCEEIVFTSGATGGINLVALSLGKGFDRGDEVVVFEGDHHSNLLPWFVLGREKGVVVRVVPVDCNGMVELGVFDSLLSERTKMVAVTHVSNVTGIVTPLDKIIAGAKRVGAYVLVDGAQAVAHFKINVKELGADFYVFSGHKIGGPTGIGVLYGRAAVLREMDPVVVGGGMVESVDGYGGFVCSDIPVKFEAGTPAIEGVLGLGAAIEYLAGVDRSGCFEWEKQLLEELVLLLDGIPWIRRIGGNDNVPIVGVYGGSVVNMWDLGALMVARGVVTRTGYMCAEPLVRKLTGGGVLLRMSCAYYNSAEEIRKAVSIMKDVFQFVRK